MSIFTTPTLTCSVCQNDQVRFGVGTCQSCNADIAYDIKGNLTNQRFVNSLAIIKVGRYFFMGLMGLLALIMLMNLLSGGFERAAILGLLIVALGLCVVGMYWLLHFVVNKFKSRNGVQFSKG